MSKKFFGKALKVVGVVAGIAAAAVTGGASLGISAALLSGISTVAALGSSLLAGKPKAPQASPADRDRLIANIDTRAPRKIVYGRTAMATDIRDQEFTGTDQEFFHRFVVCAAHKVGSIDEIWFDDKLAWTVGGGVQGEFVSYLTVDVRTEGSAANAINISPRMGSTRRYTGLAYVHFRYKLTGNSKSSESPFSQAIPTRVTIVGDAMPIYDPRLDTAYGGVGSHSATDQNTWDWGTNTYRNPALQLLNYLLGWRINGKISVGKGIPIERIDVQSFIDAANLCDEAVSLAAGGTEPRYRADGIFSERDPMNLITDQYKSSMNATLDDVDGRIRLQVLYNDLAIPVASFTEDDILGQVDWRPQIKLPDQFNIIRGTFTDPSNNSLYQSVAYPEVEIASEDGIDRIETINYPLVQSSSQCQRLAKQRLQRMQFGGTFIAEYQATAWKVQKGDVIEQTFPALGFTNKLFRVVDTDVKLNGVVSMFLREEDAALYLWDQEEAPAVVPAPPDTYDYTLNPLFGAEGNPADLAELDPDAANELANKNPIPPGIAFGGVGDVVFHPNFTVFPGTPNDGEIDFTGSRLRCPNLGTFTIVQPNVITPWEGSLRPRNDVGYVIQGTVTNSSRFAGHTEGSNTMFVADYDWSTGQWYAKDNTNAQFAFTPNSTDCLIAIVIKSSVTGGIDSLHSLLGEWTALPEDNATVGADWTANLANRPPDADLLNAQQLWADVGGADRPADNATVGGQTIGLRINSDTDGGYNPGECSLTGFNEDGVLANEIDGRVNINGEMVNIERDQSSNFTILTGVANQKGQIVFDRAKTDPFTVNGTAMDVAFAWKEGSQWYYDDNTATPVAFTPTDDMYVIGWLETGVSDFVVAGGVFQYGIPIRVYDFRADGLTSLGRATDEFVSSGDGRNFAKLVASGQAADGDVIAFGQSYGSIPTIVFGPGGSGPAEGAEVQVRADNLTVSGFDMTALEVDLVPGTVRTDTGSVAGAGGEPDRVMEKGTNSEPWNGLYTYQVNVTVPEIAPGEPGNIQLAFFARQSGVWTQVGSASYSNGGVKNKPITPGSIAQTADQEYGVSVVSATFGASLVAFAQVTYTEGAVTETSLTSNTDIPWSAYLEQ